ncbi:hypothetical protein [Halomonas campaniensis]|uniref:Uncharacterized protein n=1 Tax=Halomonas campaniensis TaxID=213554 RepID=A0A246S457_9GAMM|nr:hypothetical protein [Halomonas campaniensis]OWV31254.1 hypothetical protein JI62_02615 [Halomonas campaniensis]
MSEDSSNLYWISLPNCNGSMPLIITVSVFREFNGEVLWDLLPMTAEILNRVAAQYNREGAVTVKVHERGDVSNIISKVTKLLASPVSMKASLVVFAQNGQVAERVLDQIRKDVRIQMIVQ